MNTRPLILVTGSTGNTGTGLVPALLAGGARVRALVHSPAKAAPLRALGAEVVIGDLGKPETLNAAVAGVDRIYLCHDAKSRRGFAEGAVRTAEWLIGKKGFYDFKDVWREL